MSDDRFPFISFAFETSALPPDVWMMLGEGLSKCQHLAGVPLKPEAAKSMSSVYLARGVAATTAIEGNTLSLDEVQAIVDSGSAPVTESRAYLEREVQNVLTAIRDIDSALQAGKRLTIDIHRLELLNKQTLAGIPDKPEVVPGQLREHDVAVGSYKAPHWTQVRALLEEFTKWLGQLRAPATPEARPEEKFTNAILAAVIAHLYIAWIHPFGNGNGRLARLIEVQILSESGVVPLVATNLLSDHYNKTRNAYYLALDAAQGDITVFVRYALRGFIDELREQIGVVRRENLLIHWESYVYERFRGRATSKARDRQRDVALALKNDDLVTPEEVTELNTSLARQYARQGERTPARDMNTLVSMGLVEKVGTRRYRARREIIEAFIPPTAS